MDLVAELPVWGVLTLGPWLAAADTEIAGARLDMVLGAMWLLGAGLMVVRSARGAWLDRPIIVPMLVWAAFAGVSALPGVTHDLGFSLAALAQLLGAAACLLMLLVVAPEQRRAAVARALAAAVAGGATAAVVGLKQWVLNVRFFGATDWRTFGTFSNPNALAGYLVLVTPLAVGLALSARARWARWLWWFAAVLCAACLPLTRSRGGVAAFVVAAFTMALLALPGSRARRFTIAVGGALALAGGFLLLPGVRDRIFSVVSDNHSLMFRVYCWRAAVEAALQHPLAGWGIGCYPIAHGATAEVGYTVNAHNDALHVAAECGVPAAVAALATFVGGVWVGVRGLGRAASDGGRLLSASIGAVCGLLTHGLLDSDWTVRPTLCAAVAVLGAMSVLASGEAGPRAVEPTSPSRRIGRCVALVVVGMLVCGIGWAASSARVLEQRGRDAEGRGDVREATALYLRAYHRYPADPSPLRRLLGPAADPEQSEWALDLLEHHYPWRADVLRAAADALAVRAASSSDPSAASASWARAEDAYLRALAVWPRYTPARVGLGACLQATGRDTELETAMRDLMALKSLPYGLYQAVPERRTLEFLYPPAVLAEIRGDSIVRGDALRAVGRYLDDFARSREKAARDFGSDAAVVGMQLQALGFSPARVRQAELMFARLLWLSGQAAATDAEKQQALRQARDVSSEAVALMERGAWPGILPATSLARAEGGL